MKALERIEHIVQDDMQKQLCDTTAAELNAAIAQAVIEEISPAWNAERDAQKRKAYYFSAEYLIGRMVFNNIYALGWLKELKAELLARGVDIKKMEDIEDAATGNGGLGRLAACFLDSAATLGLPLVGYGIKYKNGLFRQKFEDGFQVEVADDWKSDTDPWFLRKEDESVIVRFHGQEIKAVPYDMPVIGFEGGQVNTLRLWQAEALREFDFQKFNDGDYAGAVAEKNSAEMITRVLYPNDSTQEGKELRLKQEYFFTSASLKDLLRRYKRDYECDMRDFAKYHTIQLNDTHPVIAIPEFIRLMGEEGVDFEDAFLMARDVFAYTNHTIMAEALETWNIDLFRTLLPKLYEIVVLINDRLLAEIGDRNKDELEILCGGAVHMARLAVYCSKKVNGVAAIHTELLKEKVLCNWYEWFPERFLNKTNGVTQRRWLALCDPELAELISEKIGWGWVKDLEQIRGIEPYIGDDSFVRRFNEAKQVRKDKLALYIYKRDKIAVRADSVFDIQIKRLHEYKRQLLNAFSILDIYFRLKSGELTDFPQTTFLFGSKAAPGYYIAKGIIKFINEIGRMIENDPAVNDILQVVFVSNYDVSYAEKLVTAADISEQISTAGMEASGTGNMKFMMNGAVTLGTYDGANIEIVQQAGEENNYIFGARVEDLVSIEGTYNPMEIYENNARLKRVIDTLIDGTVSDGNTGMFRAIYDMLLHGSYCQQADKYRLLLDFEDYVNQKLCAIYDTKDKMAFGRKCLYNVARSAFFSSDRTVGEYAREIWEL
ncbi:MAG: glycogen/starch/alpha-glucan phosphorylase [Christensenella sp.]|uniref:glycogen/starch/alpha-glucan phosphorylase n=1 Tax=Christensenella sp. TaxID=1935934 RepID=UPI002B209473|nr:glycogen/starch/alpha-glucan phosphorylase [Christensenella sp.]MEA5004534.1 glycogen/starch/alpha-glucan phosphorylase [Christensenella sp.]